ncbi:MAG: hypothetical protein LBL07_01915 [Tannerella sp.]|jgi:hypothetical protein|nr:hypothetical protein [Tannerella sp.]
MKHSFFSLIATVMFATAPVSGVSVSGGDGVYNDGRIAYAPVKLTEAEKQIIAPSVEAGHKRYEPEYRMTATDISGWQYHMDAQSGHYHDVRGSFSYAGTLLDYDDPQYRQRAFDIIEKTISLQETNPASPYCGVWPYFEEEPVATKKTPVDFNWADFNAVSLLDIYTGHRDELPQDLRKKIEDALILAAKSIQRRNVHPNYTNIAIMGTYVTYMVSHLFNLPEMQEYAQKKLKTFYDWTREKNGFSEYNSPTYTITAIDELNRMQRHIVEPEAKRMIDELYATGWTMIARHYHKPTAQWTGPQSRSYGSLVGGAFYGLLYQASDGKIDIPGRNEYPDVKIRHRIPENLLPYFLNPQYPRCEKDVFENSDPQITGTSYLTGKYALSTSSVSSLWNQRRPFLAYWGTPEKPSYLQVRLLHDLYDFSAAIWFGAQKDNTVLAAINFAPDGGDRHLYLSPLDNGKFMAKDLRLRFEFGNTGAGVLAVPKTSHAPVDFTIDGLRFHVQLYYGVFEKFEGHWETGGDGKTAWMDYVIYTGDETEIDLTGIDTAALGFAFALASDGDRIPAGKAAGEVRNGILSAEWNGLKVSAPVKPENRPRNF